MYDARQLTLIVSNAVHHLHAVTGNVSTALLDVEGKMLFSNSALSHVSGNKMITLARQYVALKAESLPKTYVHPLDEDNVIYLTVLDSRHVFVAIVYKQDELPVQSFTERLTRLLPSQVGIG